MDDYAREMMELKTLVTRTLEKKGVLAKIRVSAFSLFLHPFSYFLPSCRNLVFMRTYNFVFKIDPSSNVPLLPLDALSSVYAFAI
jgi:hypothetical protein